MEPSIRLVTQLYKVRSIVDSIRRVTCVWIHVAVTVTISLECIGTAYILLDKITHAWNVIVKVAALVLFGEIISAPTTLLKSILERCTRPHLVGHPGQIVVEPGGLGSASNVAVATATVVLMLAHVPKNMNEKNNNKGQSVHKKGIPNIQANIQA